MFWEALWRITQSISLAPPYGLYRIHAVDNSPDAYSYSLCHDFVTSAYEFLKPSLNYPQLAAEATLGIMFVAIFATTYLVIKHELFVKLQIHTGTSILPGRIPRYIYDW